MSANGGPAQEILYPDELELEPECFECDGCGRVMVDEHVLATGDGRLICSNCEGVMDHDGE